MEKSTHEPFNTELFAPITKSVEGKYLAVLSDNSVDRDDEIVHEKALEKVSNDGYIVALVDHENKIENQVAEWVNRRVVTIDGHKALIAEPKFYMSNPKAKMIKGMLDEGAQMGISIGAIVNRSEDMTCKDGKVRKHFMEMELLEASFVAIPSNRHGRAMAVAKSYKNYKEESKMDEEKSFVQKDIDNAVDAKASELEKSFDAEKVKMTEELDVEKSAKAEVEKSLEAEKSAKIEVEKNLEAANVELAKVKAELETEKAKSVEKGKHEPEKMTQEALDKGCEEGKVPISYM